MEHSILSGDFVDLGTVTSRNQTAPYYDHNVVDYWHLKRRFRAQDLNVNDWILKFELEEYGEPFVALFLNDVNFDKVQIQGSDDDVTWDCYDTGIKDISLDRRVDRYKVYIPMPDFDCMFLRIFIPATASLVADGFSGGWEVGSVVGLGSTFTVKKNAYTRTATKPYQDLSMPSGGNERVALGDELKWEGSFVVDLRAESDEDDYLDINLMENDQPMIFYENAGDTSKAYLCLRDTEFEANLLYRGAFRGNTIKMKELV